MTPQTLHDLLKYYLSIGVDELVEARPVNRYEVENAAADLGFLQQNQSAPPPRAANTQTSKPAPQPKAAPAPAAAPDPGSQPQNTRAHNTRELAAACTTLAELEAAIRQFKGLAITKTATNTVFADGNPHADVMFIGEAPGNEEDRQGKPFVGPAGKLLDRMLAAIGRDRSNVYISNILNWRPPGNRTPTPDEAHTCLPFIHRHIQLVGPKVVVMLGGTAAKHLLGTTQGIMRLRGKWTTISLDDTDAAVRALPTLHPAYLLRSPAAKKMAWADFLKIEQALDSDGKEHG